MLNVAVALIMTGNDCWLHIAIIFPPFSETESDEEYNELRRKDYEVNDRRSKTFDKYQKARPHLPCFSLSSLATCLFYNLF